jgi:choline dehydrogenase-like flavoprotein
MPAASHTYQPIGVDPATLTTKIVQTCPVVSFGHRYRERIRNAGNVRVCLHASAIRLETNPRGDRVHAVEVGAIGGRRFRVSARAFVLAGGGIANPRLLLCSNDVNPNGLANDHDLVGRFFMEHPYVDIPLGRWERGSDLRFHHRGEQVGGTTVWGQFALSEDLMRLERASGMSLWFVRLGVLSGALAGLLRTLRPGRPTLDDPRAGAYDRPSGVGAVVKDVWRKLARRARRLMPGGGYLLRVELEQAPDPRNRVRLSVERDGFGQRGVDLVFGLTDKDLRRHARLLRIAADELGLDGGRIAAQMHRMFRAGQADFFWHHMGTTRMHPDPKQGVVDSDCRVHGVSNLFVAGSSVFPTGGTAPPTLTIVALALRLAEHIHQRYS